MSGPGAPTLFDELGGEPVLRRVIDEFVDRIFDDVMIGFLFRNASRERVKAKEYEFAARHLGADVAYTGKTLPEAHRPHRIMGGQFNRRLQILRETLEELEVPARVREHWIRHTEALREQITGDTGAACDPYLAARGRPRPEGPPR
jgi:hemoglobin